MYFVLVALIPLHIFKTILELSCKKFISIVCSYDNAYTTVFLMQHYYMSINNIHVQIVFSPESLNSSFKTPYFFDSIIIEKSNDFDKKKDKSTIVRCEKAI